MILAWVVAVWGLRDQTALKFLWLVPIRDLLSFGIWIYSWFSNSMNWRGRNLKLDRDGKLLLKSDQEYHRINIENPTKTGK